MRPCGSGTVPTWGLEVWCSGRSQGTGAGRRLCPGGLGEPGLRNRWVCVGALGGGGRQGAGGRAQPAQPNPIIHFLSPPLPPQNLLSQQIPPNPRCGNGRALQPTSFSPGGAAHHLKEATWIPRVDLRVFPEDHCGAPALGTTSPSQIRVRERPHRLQPTPHPRESWPCS